MKNIFLSIIALAILIPCVIAGDLPENFVFKGTGSRISEPFTLKLQNDCCCLGNIKWEITKWDEEKGLPSVIIKIYNAKDCNELLDISGMGSGESHLAFQNADNDCKYYLYMWVDRTVSWTITIEPTKDVIRSSKE